MGGGGGMWVHSSGSQCMVAVAACYKKALVSAGWAICQCMAAVAAGCRKPWPVPG